MANIDHAMGCPIECPRSQDGSVCSARGICYFGGFNSGKDIEGNDAELQCLCMQGYTGLACEQVGITAIYNELRDETSGVTWAGIFIFMFFIVIGVPLFGLLYNKLSELYYWILDWWKGTGSQPYMPIPQGDLGHDI